MSNKRIWQPNPGPQTWALERKEREILFGGARGGGKSEAGLAWLCEPEYIKHPMFRALVLRKNYDDLKDWIDRARYFYQNIAEIVGQPAEVRFKSGAVARLGHWNDKEALGKYLGHEYQKMLLEELTETIATEEEYLKLLGSLRTSNPDLRPQVFATTNPGNRGHAWVKKRFVIPAYKKTFIDPASGYSRIFIPSTVTDNPFIQQDYVHYLNGLPEPLRSAWMSGSWEGFEGQFFTEFGTHLAEQPFFIEPSCANGRLIGSLDSGTSHATSFGLWYIDAAFTIHRLFSYLGTGGTIAMHAQEVYDKLEAFTHSGGYFPDQIFADPSMWTKVKLNENMVRAPIDEYIDLFVGKYKKTQFVKANNDKVNGCQIMRQNFKMQDNNPRLKYFRGYNTTFEEGISAVITDKNNAEIYAKMDGDDAADEARYGIVAAYSIVATLKQQRRTSEPQTALEKLLANEFEAAKSDSKEAWYNA